MSLQGWAPNFLSHMYKREVHIVDFLYAYGSVVSLQEYVSWIVDMCHWKVVVTR